MFEDKYFQIALLKYLYFILYVIMTSRLLNYLLHKLENLFYIYIYNLADWFYKLYL